jgi:DNA-binding SARP family transcriptional activator
LLVESVFVAKKDKILLETMYAGESGQQVFFGILGPLQVIIGNRVLHIPKSRQLTILALLLTEANRLVSIHQMIDEVWGDTPPETADKQIQTCVWRLRDAFKKAGAPNLIETKQSSYLLRLSDGNLDVHIFEKSVQRAQRHAEAGDLRGAEEAYRAALRLFRGPPMAGFESRSIEAVGAYWTERRLSTLEDCLDVELAMGRHRELVSELMLLVAEHPLREQLRAQLMTALYKSQRRADALAVYRAGRATLAHDLGLEPCARLQDLQRRILAGQPVSPPQQPQRATKVPTQLPPDICDFTGRFHEMQWISRELCRERGDGPRIVALVGSGGVGKTALAVHAAHRLGDHFPDGQLYADMHASKDPAQPMQILSAFLCSLGLPEQCIPGDLAARMALFRNVTAGRRLLILLDGAADTAHVTPLLPACNSSSVLCTSQASMAEIPSVSMHCLDGLPTNDGVQLLAQLTSVERIARRPDSARLIVELCGHLPLAIRAAGAQLHAEPTHRIDWIVDRLAELDRRIAELNYGSLGQPVCSPTPSDSQTVRPVQPA